MTSSIPVSIIGCPIEFSVSKKIVFFDTNTPLENKTLLAPERVYTHPVLGNMTPKLIETCPKTGHATKVFCHLLDNKIRLEV